MKWSLFLLLLTTSAFADDPYSYPVRPQTPAAANGSSNTSSDPQLEYQLPSQEERKKTRVVTPESVRYYIKSGYSVGTIDNRSTSFLPTALGTRRYADEFFYGFEFSTHFARPQQLFMTNLNLGHHFLTWRHRVKPWGSLNFGYAQIKNSKDAVAPTGSGISLGLEVGFDLFKAGPLIFSTGYKYDHVFINNDLIKNVNVQNIYLGIGFGF